MNELASVVVCALSLVACAEKLDFASEETWKIESHGDLLRVERAEIVDGAACLAIHGATTKCDTAICLRSKRIQIPVDAREFAISVEACGTKRAADTFGEGRAWCNEITWFDANDKTICVQGLAHLLVPDSRDFRRMYDWGRIPAGATACEIRLGFDAPNLVGNDVVRYRNFIFKAFPEGQSRADELAAAWQKTMKDVLYPQREGLVPKITLRDDGMTLVDGKPFFPIGIYSVCKREFNDMSYDKAFAGLKEAGFNFAHTYDNAYNPEFLAAAAKYGFKLWVSAKLPDRNLLDVGRYHPSILAWYLGDDTSSWLSVREMSDYHAAVKAVDPDRITCQADCVDPNCPESNYAAYVRATDVFMPEIYPVRGKAGDKSDRTCVARTIWDMETVRSDVRNYNDGKPRACWPILQWFLGWSMWEHFPTREQLWATSWAAVIHGANGIIWYTYGGFDHKQPGRNDQGITSTPERWNTISKLAHEFARLSPVLLERTPAEQPAVEVLSGPARDPLDRGPSVTCLLKRHAGQDWLFAVNAAFEQVRAKVVLPGGKVVEREFGPFEVFIHHH